MTSRSDQQAGVLPDESRGAHLLDAALALIAERGFGGLSMRTVATRADVSLAQVQYYFRTKNDLVAAAFDRAGSEFLATIGADLEDEPTPERLRRIIERWLPLDDERDRRARIWLAYASIAPSDSALGVTNAQLDRDLRARFADQLEVLRARGELRDNLDPHDAAAQLLALIDGAVLHCLTLPIEERHALADRIIGTWLGQHAAQQPLPS